MPVVDYDAHGHVLTVTYLDSPCRYESRTIRVTETDTEVRVSITAPQSGHDCIDNTGVSSQIVLRDPLGDRTVMDESTGSTIARMVERDGGD